MNLEELKNATDNFDTEIISFRNKFVHKLMNLGFTNYEFDGRKGKIVLHPDEKGKAISLEFMDCYGKEKNSFKGYFRAEVLWNEPHVHSENCEWDCNEKEDSHRRPATKLEIYHLIHTLLSLRMKKKQSQHRQAREIANIKFTS